MEWYKAAGKMGGATFEDILHWVEILKEKPESNKWVWKITDGGQFNYFYQTPLADVPEAQHPDSSLEYFERDGDDYVRLNLATGGFFERTLDIDGSIAVFHKTKKHHRLGGKNYKTGHVMTIPRPKAVDATGKSTWCEIQVVDGVYTRTTPQKFLDEAVYPVRTNETLGWIVETGTGFGFVVEQLLVGGIGPMVEDGTLDSLHIWDRDADAVVDSYMVLYADDGGGDPGAKIYLSAELSFGAGASVWHIDTGPTGQALSNGAELYLGCTPKNLSDWQPQYNNTGSQFFGYDTLAYPPPDPAPSPFDTENDVLQLSAYITYTPGAGGGATPKGPLHHPLWGALAGPIFCIITIVSTLLKGLRQ